MGRRKRHRSMERSQHMPRLRHRHLHHPHLHPHPHRQPSLFAPKHAAILLKRESESRRAHRQEAATMAAKRARRKRRRRRQTPVSGLMTLTLDLIHPSSAADEARKARLMRGSDTRSPHHQVRPQQPERRAVQRGGRCASDARRKTGGISRRSLRRSKRPSNVAGQSETAAVNLVRQRLSVVVPREPEHATATQQRRRGATSSDEWLQTRLELASKRGRTVNGQAPPSRVRQEHRSHQQQQADGGRPLLPLASLLLPGIEGCHCVLEHVPATR